MNFMQNHTKIIIAIDCNIKVALIFMPYLVPNIVGLVRFTYPENRAGAYQLYELTAQRSLQLADKRVCESEEQRNTHTDHCDGVKQADSQEELTLQHRRQFRLTSRTFQQATAQDTYTDTNAECAQTNQQGYSDCGHTNYSFHQ
jgi:hypothetical protein